jgi:hypothetical protein
MRLFFLLAFVAAFSLLPLIPDIFNQESILVFPTQETLGGGTPLFF